MCVRTQRRVQHQLNLSGTDQVHDLGLRLLHYLHRQAGMIDHVRRPGRGIQFETHAVHIACKLQAPALVIPIDANKHRAPLRQSCPSRDL